MPAIHLAAFHEERTHTTFSNGGSVSLMIAATTPGSAGWERYLDAAPAATMGWGAAGGPVQTSIDRRIAAGFRAVLE
jgi:hypothetical protein